MSFRTKSIEQSITARSDAPNVMFVEYQPGDGTRYCLVFTNLSHGVTERCLGTSEGSVLVTVVNFDRSPSMVVACGDGFLAPWYVEDKMGIKGASSVTLAEIIAHFCGRTALTPEQYEEHMKCCEDENDRR